MSVTTNLKDLAKALKSCDTGCALTGAGVSVGSGIPDFRSENGLWTIYDPGVYASFQRFVQDPSYFWEMHIDVMHLIQKAAPNPAHSALAELEDSGYITGVITQNIDGLHQKAGSETVYELHGTNETCSCTVCGKTYETQKLADHLFSFKKDELVTLMRKGKEIPTCECGGWIKPDVILFGEMMPLTPLKAAEELAKSSDFIIVVGSSLQVQPAAALPFVTRRNGGKISIINKEKTPVDAVAAHVIHADAEDILPQLVKLLQ
ncbi:MAG: NAD-dependent deacylase [Candidatus Methanofastidiosia archaeon]|jgi:NAD-dependent deacetylase